VVVRGLRADRHLYSVLRTVAPQRPAGEIRRRRLQSTIYLWMYLDIAHADFSSLAYRTKAREARRRRAAIILHPTTPRWQRPRFPALCRCVGLAAAIEPGRYEIVARPKCRISRRACGMPRRASGAACAATSPPRFSDPAASVAEAGLALPGDAATRCAIASTAQARGASGSARLTGVPAASGRPEVKMGGKNMTFAQRIEAVRQGP
jgi:hypothetical protein